jgi:hypothetical protein
VPVLTNKGAASVTSSFGSMRSCSASKGKWGQIGRDKCRNSLGLRGVAVSLDRLTVGASRQPELMDGPHSGIRRHDANRLSLLVDCHRLRIFIKEDSEISSSATKVDPPRASRSRSISSVVASPGLIRTPDAAS